MAAVNSTYKIKANDFLFSFTSLDIDEVSIIRLSPVEFHLIKDHRCVQAKIIEVNSAGKKLSLDLDGEIIEIEIKDELDQVLEQMGFGLASNKQVKEIKAPMPGLVLEIAVTDGQEVNEGEKLLILEAMKMENSIMIQSSAKIKRIAVSPGQAVEKGQVLIELE